MSGTLDPEYHRPEGMEMAGWVSGVRPDDDCCVRLECAEDDTKDLRAAYGALTERLTRAEEALREAIYLCEREGFADKDCAKIIAYYDEFLEGPPA